MTDKFTISNLKEEFCGFCHRLYDRHLVAGVGGNIGFRAGDGVWLTPSGYSLKDVRPDLVTTVDIEGLVLEGPQPTKDAGIHLGIFRERPDVRVVCHSHGANIIGASALLNPGEISLPPLTPGFVFYAYPLPMIPFLAPGTQALADSVVHQMSKKGRRALLLQNHGLVTVGKDFQEAFNVAEEIEEAARIFIITGGKAKAIPLKEIDKIR